MANAALPDVPLRIRRGQLLSGQDMDDYSVTAVPGSSGEALLSKHERSGLSKRSRNDKAYQRWSCPQSQTPAAMLVSLSAPYLQTEDASSCFVG